MLWARLSQQPKSGNFSTGLCVCLSERVMIFYHLALLTPIFSAQDKFHPTPSVVRKVVPLPKSFQKNGFSKITLLDVLAATTS